MRFWTVQTSNSPICSYLNLHSRHIFHPEINIPFLHINLSWVFGKTLEMRVATLLFATLAMAIMPASFAQSCGLRVPDGGYHQLMRTGETINGPHALGTMLDKNMKPLLDKVRL